MILLGARMNVGVPFCSVDPFLPLPTVANAAQTLRAAFDETERALNFRPPGIEIVEKVFNESLKVYESAAAQVEALRTRLEAELVESLLITQIEKSMSTLINDRGYSRHNAAVQVMMLEDMGLGRAWMNEAVRSIAREEPANPFFQFVAYRRENKDAMLPLILEECPAQSTDAGNRRTQWSWERDSAKAEWVNTMYWDCLFIARAYLDGSTPPAPDESLTEEMTKMALEAVMRDLDRLLKLAEGALEQFKKVAALAGDPSKTILDVIEDPVAPCVREVVRCFTFALFLRWAG